jgi:hypothetical protein
MFNWSKKTREKMAVGVKEGTIPSKPVIKENDNFHTAKMNIYPKPNIVNRLTGLINRRLLNEEPIYKAVIDGANQENEEEKIKQWIEYVSRSPKKEE